eukprot:4327358-Pyramimonas_sp.AAC.1
MDCGATTLMSGSETVQDYAADCKQKGRPIQNFKFEMCRRPLRCGSGMVEHAHRPVSSRSQGRSTST